MWLHQPYCFSDKLGPQVTLRPYTPASHFFSSFFRFSFFFSNVILWYTSCSFMQIKHENCWISTKHMYSLLINNRCTFSDEYLYKLISFLLFYSAKCKSPSKKIYNYWIICCQTLNKRSFLMRANQSVYVYWKGLQSVTQHI